jgi:hypothetical protein
LLGADEQAGEVHDGHAGGQPAYHGRIEQAAGVIAKRFGGVAYPPSALTRELMGWEPVQGSPG